MACYPYRLNQFAIFTSTVFDEGIANR